MRGAKGKEGRDETEMVPAHLNVAGSGARTPACAPLHSCL